MNSFAAFAPFARHKMKTLKVLFTPADFAALPQCDLRRTACVVFDVLWATSTIVTALAHGAAAVIPVADITKAQAWRARQPDVLLAGERDGMRIRGERAGGNDFDLGNSPREFTPEIVRGKTIVTTTTNGTRALRACAASQAVLACSFLNLNATALALGGFSPENVLLVCSGTGEQAAFEDTLAAGAMAGLIWDESAAADSARMARELFLRFQADLAGAMIHSANARRLLARPDLCGDVALCLRRDCFQLAAEMRSGRIIQVPG